MRREWIEVYLIYVVGFKNENVRKELFIFLEFHFDGVQGGGLVFIVRKWKREFHICVNTFSLWENIFFLIFNFSVTFKYFIDVILGSLQKPNALILTWKDLCTPMKSKILFIILSKTKVLWMCILSIYCILAEIPDAVFV